MENKTTIRFRTDIAGNLIEVTEFNTRITYTADRTFGIGRLEIAYNRVLILRTMRARIKYASYNNAISRFHRTAFSRFQRIMRVLGFSVRMTY